MSNPAKRPVVTGADDTPASIPMNRKPKAQSPSGSPAVTCFMVSVCCATALLVSMMCNWSKLTYDPVDLARRESCAKKIRVTMEQDMLDMTRDREVARKSKHQGTLLAHERAESLHEVALAEDESAIIRSVGEALSGHELYLYFSNRLDPSTELPS